jgi:hypothetical protein
MATKRDPDVPEAAKQPPPIRTPDEDARRAERRLERQESVGRPRWPRSDDELRQGGELSPDPEKRR